jgi:small subunit ribosomal protein S18
LVTAVKEKPKSRRADPKRPKKNMFTTMGVTEIDYKDTAALRLFISDRGKIRARSVTGLMVRQQRQVATAIKNARDMALLPYSPGSSR